MDKFFQGSGGYFTCVFITAGMICILRKKHLVFKVFFDGLPYFSFLFPLTWSALIVFALGFEGKRLQWWRFKK